MIICVRPSLTNSTTATRRLPPINTAPQLPGPMDSRRQGLPTSTDILHNHKGMEALHRLGLREDTGAVGRRSPREDILELDMALAGSHTHPAHMDSLHLARADGVATRRGIELDRLLEFLDAGRSMAAGGKDMGHQVVGESREGKAFPGGLCILLRMRRITTTVIAREVTNVMQTLCP